MLVTADVACPAATAVPGRTGGDFLCLDALYVVALVAEQQAEDETFIPFVPCLKVMYPAVGEVLPNPGIFGEWLLSPDPFQPA